MAIMLLGMMSLNLQHNPLLTPPSAVDALSSSAASPKKKYYGGAGVGRLVIDDKVGKEGAVQCHYDMVLCERLQERSRTKTSDVGLYIPEEDLPRLHMCRVLSLGPGREEENGRVSALPDNIKVGSIVIAKNPWGIGPKDEETSDGKKLSYMRFQDIAAVVTGGLVSEDG